MTKFKQIIERVQAQAEAQVQTQAQATSVSAKDPLKLDAEWYCNCIGNGEAILKSSQALAKFPQVKAVLEMRGLNSFVEGLYNSPYCNVPTLDTLKQQAIAKSFEFNCPNLWGAARCDNHRNGLREQYLAEAITNHDKMCQDASLNELKMIEAIATKANTEVQNDIVEETLTPEARQEAETEMQQKNKQGTWVVVAIVIAIAVLGYFIFKK